LLQMSHTPFIGRFIQFCSDKQREQPRPSKSPYQRRPLRKETVSALNCENVESFLSDYMDDILDRSSITTLQGHLRICPACQDTLLQMHQVRTVMHNLAGQTPPASYTMRLNNRLHEELYREYRPWLQSVAWGFALAAAVAILLWPPSATGGVSSESAVALGQDPSLSVTITDRGLGHSWTRQLSSLSGPLSHAHKRSVSF
jgi:hypothetical protein